jgi:hypothetical protein
MTAILYMEVLYMFNQKFTLNLFVALLLTVSQVSFAQTQSDVVSESHSIGGLKNNLPESEESKVALLAQGNASQRTLALKGMNRADVIRLRQQSQIKQGLASSILSQDVEYNTALHHSFSVYTGYSQLITDIDEDGYYQRFSVSFDADILSPVANEQALVYADLYLSQNGGPWELYFSTDDFVITGEDSADEFEVVTQLDTGYLPDHYEVLIDLYEVGFSDVVATYSSNDSNALYALPLESSDYDPEYIEVEYYHEHGGASLWLLLSSLFIVVYRRRKGGTQ